MDLLQNWSPEPVEGKQEEVQEMLSRTCKNVIFALLI